MNVLIYKFERKIPEVGMRFLKLQQTQQTSNITQLFIVQNKDIADFMITYQYPIV